MKLQNLCDCIYNICCEMNATFFQHLHKLLSENLSQYPTGYHSHPDLLTSLLFSLPSLPLFQKKLNLSVRTLFLSNPSQKFGELDSPLKCMLIQKCKEMRKKTFEKQTSRYFIYAQQLMADLIGIFIANSKKKKKNVSKISGLRLYLFFEYLYIRKGSYKQIKLAKT